MSKAVGSSFQEQCLNSETATFAILFKLTRPDGTILGFTNHDEDIVYSGVPYKASTGNFPTAMSQSGNLAVDNIEALAFLDSSSITEEDIVARLYDYSTIDIYLADYIYSLSPYSYGVMILAQGWKLGELTIRNNAFTFEIRSKTQILQQQIIELYSPDCRADLGDACCVAAGGNVTSPLPTLSGTVTGVTDNRTFADSGRTEANDYFNYGLLTWTGACANSGTSMEVKDYTLSGGGFVLVEKMGFDIEVGDTYKVYAGCDKLKATCKDKFNNIINFRGEPFLPGMDELMKVRFT